MLASAGQQVDPGHALYLADLPHGLGREPFPLGGGPVRRDRPQPTIDIIGHVDPGQLVPDEVQGPPGFDDAHAGQDGAPLIESEVADLRHPPAERRDIEDELGLDELRAGGDLLAEPLGADGGRLGERVLHRAEETVRRRIDHAPGQQGVLVAHGAQGPQQLDTVQVEHWLGLGMVTDLRVIARHHQDVADAERGCAEQVGLQRDAVAVPARHLHDGLEPGGQRGQAAGPAGQPHVRALIVGDVGGVDPVAQPRSHLRDRGRARPARRADLRGDREAARGQALAQAHRRGESHARYPRRSFPAKQRRQPQD